MQLFSHLPDRIFLIFCIPLEGVIGHILEQTACRNDFSFSIYWGKGAKIEVRIGTENLLCRFLQFGSLDFSDFQQAVRAQHWVHLRRICISNRLPVLHISQIDVFRYFLKLDSWYYAKKPYFSSILAGGFYVRF